jgi:acetyl esterase
MTRSLPAETVTPAKSAAARRSGKARELALATATRATLHLIPRLPQGLKRLLLRGRSITVEGNTLDTTLQLTLAAQRAAGLRGLVSSDDVAVARTRLRADARAFPGNIAISAVNDLSIPGPAGPMSARHYQPGDSNAPLLVFYHGGGFVLGDLEVHDQLCRLICRDGAVHVLAIDYRLAPEHKAPAAVEDAYAAYRWALDHAADLGADPARIAVGGDSAGGNLAAVVSQLARNDGVRLPALQLLIYPVTDQRGQSRSRTLFADGFYLTKRDMDFCSHQYLAGASVDANDPLVSPLLADDLSGLPPALILTAGFDPLRDEGNQYAEALRAAGNLVDLRQYGSLIHAFTNFFPVGGGSAAGTADMISALRAHLSHG